MPAYSKVAGVWQQMTALHTKVAGVWQPVQNGYVKVAGVWQEFFANAVIAINDTSVDVFGFGSQALAEYRVLSNGQVTGSYGFIENWITPTSAAPGSYVVRATLISGDTPSGTLGTWLSLSSNQVWSVITSPFVPDEKSCQLLIEIGVGTTAIDSATVTLYAEFTDPNI